MSWLSQKTSAPICMIGVLRYPPVNGITSGFGGRFGISTERHDKFFKPRITLTFSDRGDAV